MTQSTIEIIRQHRRHVELSPGIGAEVQTYALACYDELLDALLRLSETPPRQETPEDREHAIRLRARFDAIKSQRVGEDAETRYLLTMVLELADEAIVTLYGRAPVLDSGASGQIRTAEQYAHERADTVRMLRQVCAEHGDNDWPDDLHLADVIEEHLWRNLAEVGSAPVPVSEASGPNAQERSEIIHQQLGETPSITTAREAVRLAVTNIVTAADTSDTDNKKLTKAFAVFDQKLDDLIAAVVAQQGQWQPIETALKDGTRVMCGFWYSPDFWVLGCGRQQFDEYHPEGYFIMEGGGKPTHWQPLPTPPAESQLTALKERT